MQPWHRLAESDQALVQRLIDTEVIPQLVSRGHLAGVAPVGPQLDMDFRLDVLLPLLLGSDPAAAFSLLDGLMAQAGSLSALCTNLLEPAARRLGDLWADDACSDFDVTLGLCRLQQAFRQHCRSLPPPERQSQVRKVLVATPPGEPHLLGTVVNTQLLWQAGWDAQCAFPPDAQTLRSLVACTWFDAVSLTLSPAFAHPQQVPQLADTIAALRAASLNQALAVVVQGRLFNDAHSAAHAAARVGADAFNLAADQIVPAMQRVLVRPRA